MKTHNFLSIFLISFIFLISCNENENGDSVPPGSLTIENIVPTNGGGILSYSLPNDSDILFVRAEYANSLGDDVYRVSSSHNNSIEIDGLNQNTPVIVRLYVVDENENISEPTEVEFTPLPSFIYLVQESISLSAELGGVRIQWENIAEKTVYVHLHIVNGDDEEIRILSSDKEFENISVRGLEAVEMTFLTKVEDFDGNITVAGDLIVSGNTTSQGQNSLTVSDPTIEVGIGNVNGADLGIIMNNPLTGGNKGNVAIIYDFSASKLEIGHTLKSSADSVITMNTANTLAVNINGDLGVTGTTDASSKTTGALIVTGGLGVAKNIHALHANFEDVEADSVTITDNTTSDSATTGALKVVGGISTQENLNVGAVAKVISATDASSKTTGALIVTGGVGISKNIHALHANFEDVEADSVNITDTTVSSSKTTGALKVAGGLGVAANIHTSNIYAGYDADETSYLGRAAVGFAGETNHASFAHIDNNTAGNYALKQTEGGTTHVNAKAGQHIRLNINNSEKARVTGAGDLKVGSNVLYVDVSETSIGVNTASPEAKLHVVGNAYVSSTTDATTTTTGALIVAGGLGIAKKIVGQHANFEDVEADSVTVTDTTESKLRTNGALIVAGGIGVASNVNTTNLHALGTTSTLSKTTGTVIVAGGVGVSGNIHALHANFEDVEADSVTITDTTEATSSTTGALKAAGGVGIAKDVYVGERAYVTGGLITNTGGVGKKTYSYSADLGSGASIANATYVLDFTNHPFHAKVTAMLIESDDEISTLIFDVIGGFLGGGSNSAYVPALGQQSIISTSTMNTPWDSTIATSLTGTTVTIKPANACSGVVRFNIFVEYLSHETAGQLSSITNSGTSAGSGAFGY